MKINNLIKFDVNNQDHINQYKYFLNNSSWEKPNGFLLETPYLSVPHMIDRKLISKLLG